MDLTLAAMVAMGASFVAFGLFASWYVVPWLRRRRDLEAALTPLLWLHVFRYVVLLVYSAQAMGMRISDGLRDVLVVGDLTGAGLALAVLVALRGRGRAAVPLAWVLVVATLADIGYAAWAGLREGLFETATGWPWVILIFYVPVLTLSALLVGWQLRVRSGARRSEPLPASGV